MTTLHYIVALVLVCLCFISASASAAWVQGNAKMNVDGLPLHQVREQAIKSAIADATFNAGVMVSSEDIILNGLVIESTVSLKTNNEIKRVEILDESLIDGILTVWVRVDLERVKNCPEKQYKKSIAVSQIIIQNPEHAVVGDFQYIGKHLSKRIKQQLNSETAEVEAFLLERAFSSRSTLESLTDGELYEKSSYLARTFDAHYTVHGVIRDMSLFMLESNQTYVTQRVPYRNFTLRIYVIDNARGEVVLEDSFHTENFWSFNINEKVDLNSSVFWKSDYGKSILNLMNHIVLEIEDTLRCAEVLYPIKAIDADGMLINVGVKDGVEVNDRFQVIKRKTISDELGSGVLREVNNSTLEVINVGADYSLLKSVSINGSVGVQLFDLVKTLRSNSREVQHVSNSN